jgi:hypothetical protein
MNASLLFFLLTSIDAKDFFKNGPEVIPDHHGIAITASSTIYCKRQLVIEETEVSKLFNELLKELHKLSIQQRTVVPAAFKIAWFPGLILCYCGLKVKDFIFSSKDTAEVQVWPPAIESKLHKQKERGRKE